MADSTILSIVVPFDGKHPQYLATLFKSLSRQSFTDYELLIVTSEATDVQQVQREHPEVTWLVDPIGNLGAARQLGQKMATGQYVMFMDADDYLLDDSLASAAKVAALTHADFLSLNRRQSYENYGSFIKLVDLSANHDLLPKDGKPVKAIQTRSLTFKKPMMPALGIANDSQLIEKNNQAYDLLLSNKFVVERFEDRYHRFALDWKDQNHPMMKDLGSVNGIWYRQAVLDQTNVTFDETAELYSDVQFTMPMLVAAQVVVRMTKPQYVRFRHNDPINNPSQSQVERDDRWYWRFRSLDRAFKAVNDDQLVAAFSTYVVQLLHNKFIREASQVPATGQIFDETYAMLQSVLKQLDPNALLKLRGVTRKPFTRIMRGDFVGGAKQLRRLFFEQRAVKTLKKRGTTLRRAFYEFVFTRFSIRKKTVVYETFLGKNFSDSPKYIYEYLEKNYPGQYRHVWVMAAGAATPQANRPHTKVVTRFGWRYMWHMATAQYLVINQRQPKWWVHRSGQTLLATWHGTPLKHLVFDMENVAGATPLYKQDFYNRDQKWDYLVVPNQYSADIFEHAFMYPQDKMLKTGYPRNDVLSSPTLEADAVAIKKKLGIPLDKKVILYAPTWRDDEYFGVGRYRFSLKLDIAKLREQFGDEYVLVLRTHYFISNNLDTTGFGDFVYNESDYDDIAELYVISDVLITDYSSVFFDYAILRRPMLFFAYDAEKYAGVLHGFYIDMNKDLPGPVLKTNDEVVNALAHLDEVEAKYTERYEAFHERFNAWEDGHAAKRVVEAVFHDRIDQK